MKADHHQADHGHADDVVRVGVSRQLGKAFFHEGEESRMNAQTATPQRASSTPKAFPDGKKISGTRKTGFGPMRIRPTRGAAPVAMTTGRKVRFETSGRRISIAARRRAAC
jgi:hypothetical protein